MIFGAIILFVGAVFIMFVNAFESLETKLDVIIHLLSKR